MDSGDDRRKVSTLAKLLREELREARFSVSYHIRTQAEVLPAERGGAISTTFERTSETTLDADGLRALHNEGAWRTELFRHELSVETLPGGAESASRRLEFECLLDQLGVLGDGHVAHALGSLLIGPTLSKIHRDSPAAFIGIARTSELWTYLVIDACLDTPLRTASKVVRWTRGAKIELETHVLLGRLRADESFVLRNGLAIERLPVRTEEFRDWVPTRASLEPEDYLDRTLLRIPCTVAPALSKPDRVSRQRNGDSSTPWSTRSDIESGWSLPPGGVHELARALSLVCDVAVETPISWVHYGRHAHFWHRPGQIYSGTVESIPRTESESLLTADDLKEALRIQVSLGTAPTDMQTAIRYWLKSKERRTDEWDGLVFLRTALEALFLDGGPGPELAFRLATNGAWYTGRNRDERIERFDALKKVYGAASGVVHTGRIKDGSAALLKEGQAICREAILKRLRSQGKPVWRDIVFGR